MPGKILYTIKGGTYQSVEAAMGIIYDKINEFNSLYSTVFFGIAVGSGVYTRAGGIYNYSQIYITLTTTYISEMKIGPGTTSSLYQTTISLYGFQYRCGISEDPEFSLSHCH